MLAESDRADGYEGSIAMPAVLDIAAATELRETLLGQIKDGAEIIIDASGVERVTTAGVQLVISAAAEAKNQTAQLKWASPSLWYLPIFIWAASRPAAWAIQIRAIKA